MWKTGFHCRNHGFLMPESRFPAAGRTGTFWPEYSTIPGRVMPHREQEVPGNFAPTFALPERQMRPCSAILPAHWRSSAETYPQTDNAGFDVPWTFLCPPFNEFGLRRKLIVRGGSIQRNGLSFRMAPPRGMGGSQQRIKWLSSRGILSDYSAVAEPPVPLK